MNILWSEAVSITFEHLQHRLDDILIHQGVHLAITTFIFYGRVNICDELRSCETKEIYIDTLGRLEELVSFQFLGIILLEFSSHFNKFFRFIGSL